MRSLTYPLVDIEYASVNTGALSPSTNAVERSNAPTNCQVGPSWCTTDASPMTRNCQRDEKALVAKGRCTSDVPTWKVSTVRLESDDIG